MLRKLFPLFLVLSFNTHADSLKILFLGDTYFGESYQTSSLYNNGINIIEEYGYDYFFENVNDILKSSDYTILNFEAPLCRNKNVTLIKPYIHWSYPAITLNFLKKYGADAVSLGNNHIMDMGQQGLEESISALEDAAIKYFGAGTDFNRAYQPLEVKIQRNIMYIYGGFEYRASYDTLYNFYADSLKGGAAAVKIELLKAAIKQLKHSDPFGFIVFFPHWGKNYKPVMKYQKELAYALIDAGVDLIIGHGAHTVQEIELYKDKWIIYNIGNFIFNAPGRYKSTGAKPYGLIVQMCITSKDRNLRLYPVYTNNKQNDYKVRFLIEGEFEDCLNTLNMKKLKYIKNYNYIELKVY